MPDWSGDVKRNQIYISRKMTGTNQEKKIKTINNYPLAFTVFIFTALLTTFINRVFSSNDDRSRDCLEQVQYLRGEVASLRKQIKEQSEREAETQEELKSYVRTLLLKDAQIKEMAKRAKEGAK